jgi:hypothetical protein
MPSLEIDEWYEAMDIKIAALQNKKAMIEIPSSQLPQGKQVVKSTWAFAGKDA